MNTYKNKYLKYKNKYLSLKNQLAGASNASELPITNKKGKRKREDEDENKNYECPICLEQMDKNYLNTTKCEHNHYFHTECIIESCKSNSNTCRCPLCRSENLTPPLDLTHTHPSHLTPSLIIRENLDRDFLLESFPDLQNRNRIYYNFTGFESIDPNAFQGLTNLNIIDIELNLIEHIEANTFSNLTGLKKIYLSTNHITTINSGAFQGSTNLKIIDLGYNNISNINPATFQNLPNLETVILSENPITNINELRTQYPNINFVM